MKKSHQAFTLVELLVVITIIGILAGIALPVFQKAQERGKALSDLSNLRQLGLAVQTYKSDNDGNILDSTDQNWALQLKTKYVSTWKVFKSPFDQRTVTEIDTTSPVSYGINNEPPATAANGKLLGIDSSKLTSPSTLILFAPAVLDNSALSFQPFNGASKDAFVTAKTVTTADRGTHGSRKRINAVFADGHAEDILWIKFIDNSSTEGKKRWIPDFE